LFCRALLSYPPYAALNTLKLDVGWGATADNYLAQLAPQQQLVALRLKIVSTAKAIVKGVPEVRLRTELGPKVRGRAGHNGVLVVVVVVVLQGDIFLGPKVRGRAGHNGLLLVVVVVGLQLNFFGT
jgi:hypothetical protein